MDTYTKRYWADINLDDLVHNYREVQKKIPGVQILCVVKADAYGHGSVEVAKALSEVGAPYFGVATSEEALQLRRNGITAPILILGMVRPEWIAELEENDITVTIGGIESAREYVEVLGDSNLKVHICIDTGMNRIGLKPDVAVEQIQEILSYPCFDVEGIWTHFAAAEDPNELEFTLNQIALFDGVVAALAALDIEIPLRHYANSDTIAHFTQVQYRATQTDINMARPGYLLYGLGDYTAYGLNLKQILSLKAVVQKVKLVKKGESVSYGRTWFAERDSIIATIGVGYADGYYRSLSNDTDVLINGQRAPQVGRITMDQLMVDVTDIPDVKPGDIVTVADDELLPRDIAARAGTIGAEFVCSLGRRVPRIYYKNGERVEAICYIDKL